MQCRRRVSDSLSCVLSWVGYAGLPQADEAAASGDDGPGENSAEGYEPDVDVEGGELQQEEEMVDVEVTEYTEIEEVVSDRHHAKRGDHLVIGHGQGVRMGWEGDHAWAHACINVGSVHARRA